MQQLHVSADISRDASSCGAAERRAGSPLPRSTRPGLKLGAGKEDHRPQPTSYLSPPFDPPNREKAAGVPQMSMQEDSRDWAPTTSSLEVNGGGEATGESFLGGPEDSALSGPELQRQQQRPSEGKTRRWQTSSFPSLLKAREGGQGELQSQPSDSGESQDNALEQPVKTLFINFFQRNLTEQRRHEEALESAGALPVLPNGSITLGEPEVRPEGKRAHGPIFAESADEEEEIVKEAEVEAANAISLFSPDERNTRFEEFSMLVKADQ
ncbi:hypothetical protein ACSSS7_002180 [Eimeria intestinalis]